MPGERVRGRYTVRGDEDFLQGHFPGRPIMPGVLMVEALAQAGCVGVLSHDDFAGKLAVFAGLEGVRFRRLVTPATRSTSSSSSTSCGARSGAERAPSASVTRSRSRRS